MTNVTVLKLLHKQPRFAYPICLHCQTTKLIPHSKGYECVKCHQKYSEPLAFQYYLTFLGLYSDKNRVVKVTLFGSRLECLWEGRVASKRHMNVGTNAFELVKMILQGVDIRLALSMSCMDKHDWTCHDFEFTFPWTPGLPSKMKYPLMEEPPVHAQQESASLVASSNSLEGSMTLDYYEISLMDWIPSSLLDAIYKLEIHDIQNLIHDLQIMSQDTVQESQDSQEAWPDLTESLAVLRI